MEGERRGEKWEMGGGKDGFCMMHSAGVSFWGGEGWMDYTLFCFFQMGLGWA